MTIPISKTRIAALLLLITSMYGCTTSTSYLATSYAHEYVKTVGIDVRPEFERDMIHIIPQTIEYRVSFKSVGKEKELYDSLCVAHKDLSYNRRIYLINDILSNSFLTPDVISYEITCESDYDALHPAGTSLKDCVGLEFTSFQEFIDSGYAYEPKTKTLNLNELTNESLRLMKDFGKLAFRTKPETLKRHSFILTIETEHGLKYSTKFTRDFPLTHLETETAVYSKR